MPVYWENLKLTYDIESIAALASRREEAWSKFNNASFLTLNEKRLAMGYPPIQGGDRLTEPLHETPSL